LKGQNPRSGVLNFLRHWATFVLSYQLTGCQVICDNLLKWQFIKNNTKLLLQTGSDITQQFSLKKFGYMY
jgi:hypothetical protein